MQILSVEAARKAVPSAAEFDFVKRANTLSTVRPYVSYPYPPDSGRKVGLARFMVSTVGSNSVLWITDHGVWPSSEDPNLFKLARTALGCQETIYEAPVHLCGEGDREDLTSLLCLVLYFFWDASLMALPSGIVWLTSNDEYISCYGATKAQLKELKDLMD